MSANEVADVLIRAAVQGSVAVVAVWALLSVWRRCPHAVRVWLWRLALVKMVVGALWFGPVTLPVLPHKANPVRNILAAQPARQSYTRVEIGKTVELTEQEARNLVPPRYSDLRLSPMRAILAIWTIGAAVSAGMALISFARSRRLRGGCERVEDPEMLRELESLSRRAGLRRIPELLSGDVRGPLVTGMIRPAIILPAALGTSCSGNARLVLAHEVAHISRMDLVWEIVPIASQIVFFFNPLVYLTRYQASLAREMACDAAALRLTRASEGEYARMLVDCVASGRASVSCVGMAEAYGALRARILSVAHPIQTGPIRFGAICVLTAAAAAVLIVPWSLTAAKEGPAAIEDTYEGLSLIPGEYNLSWELRSPETEPDYTKMTYGVYPLNARVRSRIRGLASEELYGESVQGFEIVIDGRAAYVFPERWMSTGIVDVRTAWKVPLKREGDMLVNDRFPVKLRLGRGSDRVTKPAEFSLRVEVDSKGAPCSMLFDWIGGWYGRIRSTKGGYEIRTKDEDRDGAFDGTMGYRSLTCSCDCVLGIDYADVEGVRTSSGLSSNYTEGMLPADGVTMFAGKLYTVRVSPKGDKVRIAPYRGPTGMLEVAAMDGYGRPAGFSLSACRGDHGLPFSGVGSRTVPLPAGRYAISAIAGVPEAGGRNVAATAELGWRIPQVRIVAGATRRLALGGPVGISITPGPDPIRAEHGRKRVVTAAPVGPAGRPAIYASPVAPLRVCVTDSRGSVVKRIRRSEFFESWSASFDAGALKPGEYTVTASEDFRPYGPRSTAQARIEVKP